MHQGPYLGVFPQVRYSNPAPARRRFRINPRKMLVDNKRGFSGHMQRAHLAKSWKTGCLVAMV
jgi:hypothetical protein